MGCQDTDFLKRMKVFGTVQFMQSQSVVGTDLPNDAAGTHTGKAHNCEKVRHVAPEFAHLRWGQMDQCNRDTMHAKLTAGQYIRNTKSPMASVQVLPSPPLECPPEPEIDDVDFGCGDAMDRAEHFFFSSFPALELAKKQLTGVPIFATWICKRFCGGCRSWATRHRHMAHNCS